MQLKKVLKKKQNAAKQTVTPTLDWSKVRFVKLWFADASPKKWKFHTWPGNSN